MEGRFLRSIQVVSLKNQRVIADKCLVADRFFVRLRGLIGRSSLERTEGMWFPRCSSVHTLWMSMSIDVVFLRPSSTARPGVWVVSSVHSSVRPWRLLPLGDWRASEVLELSAGAAKEGDLSPGDDVQCIG